MTDEKKDPMTTASPIVGMIVKPTEELTVVPQDLQNSEGLGTEGISKDDLKPAQLKICQAGSPQRKTDDPKQIVGLSELDLFNDLSNENYGRKLDIVVISMMGHRNIEFKPGELGVVLDRNVSDDDPRCVWPVGPDGQSLTDEKGKKLKPKATKYFNFLLWIPSTFEIAVLSLSSTQTAVAIKFMNMLKLPLKIGKVVIGKPPSWARTYEISTFMDKDGDLSWGALNLRQIGITPEETRVLCSTLYKTYAGKEIEIQYAPAPDNANTIEREPVVERTDPGM